MKKKILIILYVIVILICGRQCLSYFYNQYVLNEYKAGNYSINEDLLLTLNIIEPYIVHYNNGNILYQNMLYEDAIEEYEKALTYPDLPKDRECKVRINIALSMVAMLPKDYDSRDNREDSIKVIREALKVLSAEGCAKKNGGGHSSRAQNLYDELLEELEKLGATEDPEDPIPTPTPTPTPTPVPSDSSETSDTSDTSVMPETSDPTETSDSETSETSDTSGSEPTPTTIQTTNFSIFESSVHTDLSSIISEASSDRNSEISSYSSWDGNQFIFAGCW